MKSAKDIIDSVKVIWDNETQPRCGWCGAPIEESKFGLIMASSCEYCGSTIRSPIRTLMNIGMASSAIPVFSRVMKNLGIFPFAAKKRIRNDRIMASNRKST